ncbi:MAG TPA: alpha/beta hydrolase [Bacteroidia bacterium]|nr:alpha/beta hydrolase [Bacteroidia bacterium]
MQYQFTEFKNARIRFTDKGKGRAIVLLHGFPLSLDIWNEFSETLSKKFRVICIDLPGHGESDCIGYVHSMELMAECVKAIMNVLHLRKYILVGHSMGGYATMAFAELFPDNIKGICLFHSSALADSESKKKDRERSIQLVKKHPKQFTNQLAENLFFVKNRARFKNEIALLKKNFSNTSQRSIIACLYGMKDRKNREMILKFAAYPILFIIGKNDTIIPMEMILPQTELPEKKEILLLDKVGHAGFYEAKNEILERLIAFSKKCFSNG